MQFSLNRKQLEAPGNEWKSIGHVVQVLMLTAPDTVEYVPARQLVHALTLLAPDTLEYLPARQLVHTLALLAPDTLEYSPARQSVQARVPLLVLYLPATHAVQTPPFGPVNPELHVHAPMAELELGELLFAGQDAHDPAPAAEYVPAPQVAHDPAPAAEYVPARQLLHALALFAPDTLEYLPARQLVHTLALLAPDTLEYVPATQSVQARVPLLVLYLPATHAVQTPPLGPVNPALHVQAPTTVLELGELLFAGQDVHDPAPAEEYVPAPQLEHDPQPVPEYVPAPQVEHDPAPPPEYVPAPQVEHDPAPDPEYVPAPQLWHVDAVFEPTVPENLPDAQSVHAAFPLLSLYLPATHDVHEPAGPVVPAAQAVEIH